ncbi:hypothetical protein KKC44_02765 [Patescibacteria group bacterium]|nr:hypothetical protein [Patescibacteria group bacterium]MBU2259506.1 hypothetical protein [Patescibacteria group bacterium]
MNKRTIICIILTLLLSAPSLNRIPRMLPFFDAEVRAKAPHGVEELRKQGIWVVNTKLQSIQKQETSTCFTFEHRYRSRGSVADPEEITICL